MKLLRMMMVASEEGAPRALSLFYLSPLGWRVAAAPLQQWEPISNFLLENFQGGTDDDDNVIFFEQIKRQS